MPIPVPDVSDSSTGALPARLLRTLHASQRTTVTDPTDGSESATWATTEILGRITRGSASETTEDGRQAAVSAVKLMTGYPDLATGDRVIDPDEIVADDSVWELAGDPVPIWGAATIHHYEVPMRRVRG